MKIKLNGQEVFVDFSYQRTLTQTNCDITEKGTRKVLYSGFALCSHKDHFCKEKGRKVALARAIKCMPRETRKQIWVEYFNRNKIIF